MKTLESEALRGREATGNTIVSAGQYRRLYVICGNGYSKLSPDILCAESAIRAKDENLMFQYNRLLAASLLTEFRLSQAGFNIPESVLPLYEREIARLEKQLSDKELSFYHLSNDAFLKDLAILSFRLIPVGAEFACPGNGVPRSLLFRGGLRQLIEGLWVCLVQAGGFQDYLELHAHPLSLEDFNSKGWDESYVRLAELLEANPGWRGVISTSWFLDPALEEISPHLAYLRRIPEANGATFLYAGVDNSGDSGALAKSSTRRRLYECGKYTPTLYTRIWPRKKLISWVRST